MSYFRDASTINHITYVATKTNPTLAERMTVIFCNRVGQTHKTTCAVAGNSDILFYSPTTTD